MSRLSLLLLVACGGAQKAQDPTALVAQDAGLPSASSVAPPTPLSGARAVPPFHLESKHVDKKAPELSAACRAVALDPKATIASITQACGLKAEGAPLSARQDPTQASASFDLRGSKGQCYRVAAVASPEVRSLVVTLMDAEGAIAAEYHTDDVTPALVPRESLCFKDDAVLKVSASVGSGSGAFSVQALKE